MTKHERKQQAWAKEWRERRFCLAQPVERIKRDIPTWLKLMSTETILAELSRRRSL